MKMPNGYGSITKINKMTRKPYWARAAEECTMINGKLITKRVSLGYYATVEEALSVLEQNYRKRHILKSSNITFKELFEKWIDEKAMEVKSNTIYMYMHAFDISKELHCKKMREIQLCDLNQVIENCGKNYPILKTLRLLYVLLFDYACMHDIVEKNIAQWVNVQRYSDKNPNKQHKARFSSEMIDKIWNNHESIEDATILMLLYSGVRIGEFLSLKKENVHLDENYFEVVASKTINGVRKVPIAEKVKPFYEKWNAKTGTYLITTEKGLQYSYENYRRNVYNPFLKQLDIELSPHCCRHTLISMLAEKGVTQTIIKKIVGHSGAMSLTERVYTHFDIRELVNAINTI